MRADEWKPASIDKHKPITVRRKEKSEVEVEYQNVKVRAPSGGWAGLRSGVAHRCFQTSHFQGVCPRQPGRWAGWVALVLRSVGCARCAID